MNDKKELPQLYKKWLGMVSALVISQILFIWIDGTILEPKVNRLGKAFVNSIEGRLEWFTLYDSPFLKFVTCMYGIYMLFVCIKDFMIPFIRR